MKKLTFLALAICFAMNTFAQTPCGDTVTHCYASGTYSIFDSAVDNAGDYITVTINAGDTESGYDDLVIYDTADNSGNVLYWADGDHSGVVIESTTGVISVWINGDGSYNCTDGSGGPYADLNMSISCAPAPSCLVPTDLTVSGVTTTSADLSWTAGATEAAWNIEYGATGFAQGAGATVAVIANSFEYVGLSANMSYDFYVQADCGANGTSAWAGPFTFTTPCDVVTVFPYAQGFEDLDCWSNDNASAAWQLGDGTNPGFGTPNPGSVTEGASAVFFNSYNYSSTLGESTLMSPSIDLSALTVPNLTFDYVDAGTDSGGTDVVEVVVDNGSGVVVVATMAKPQTWTPVIVDLSAYATETIKIGFRASSDYGYSNPHIDNLKVVEAPFTPPTWVGDWLLDPVAGALAVGPNAGSVGEWYASSAADVDTRACLFDDIHRFNADGTYEQIMQDQTWLEGWQGVAEGCGTPIAPHDGSNAATYTYTGETVTVIGDGAFMGLAKVHNTGEDGVSGGSINYNIVSVDENYLVVNIQYAPGADNTWQFRVRNANYTPPTTDVTFTVNTESIEEGVGPNGMYIGGGILGDAQAYAMTDADADGTWEVTLTLNEGTTGNYIFLNSPNNGGDWGAKEVLTGQECADGQYDDRLLAPVGADDYTLQHCFGSCDTDGTCSSLGIDDAELSQFTYFPNPVNNVLTIKAQASIDNITVYNMLGQAVVRATPNTNNSTVDMSELQTGAYFVQVSIDNTLKTVRVIKN